MRRHLFMTSFAIGAFAATTYYLGPILGAAVVVFLTN